MKCRNKVPENHPNPHHKNVLKLLARSQAVREKYKAKQILKVEDNNQSFNVVIPVMLTSNTANVDYFD